MNRLTLAACVFGIAVSVAGCASSAYAPPQHSRASASAQCPAGRVWVCRDGFKSELPGKPEPLDFCMCQGLQGVR